MPVPVPMKKPAAGAVELVVFGVDVVTAGFDAPNIEPPVEGVVEALAPKRPLAGGVAAPGVAEAEASANRPPAGFCALVPLCCAKGEGALVAGAVVLEAALPKLKDEGPAPEAAAEPNMPPDAGADVVVAPFDEAPSEEEARPPNVNSILFEFWWMDSTCCRAVRQALDRDANRGRRIGRALSKATCPGTKRVAGRGREAARRTRQAVGNASRDGRAVRRRPISRGARAENHFYREGRDAFFFSSKLLLAAARRDVSWQRDGRPGEAGRQGGRGKAAGAHLPQVAAHGPWAI